MKMRTTTLKLLVIISIAFALSSCHKEHFDQSSDLSVSIPTRVSEWLESRKLGNNTNGQASPNVSVNSVQIKNNHTNRNANIEMLKSNLDYNASIKVPQSKKVDILLIPINESVKATKHVAEIATLNIG